MINNIKSNTDGNVHVDYDFRNKPSLSGVMMSLGFSVEHFSRCTKMNCPFHDDSSPSFVIYWDNQKWHCFGCGLRGDVYDFIVSVRHCSLTEALDFVNQKLVFKKDSVDKGKNFPLVTKDLSVNTCTIDYERTKGVSELCLMYYQERLFEREIYIRYFLGTRSLKIPIYKGFEIFTPYGFQFEALRRYRIGFAPANQKDLIQLLLAFGYSKEEIASTGLFSFSKKGVLAPLYRNRIVFPYLDREGLMVYSTGRRTHLTIPSQYEPKYIKQFTAGSRPYVSKEISNNYIFSGHVAEYSDWIVITEGITDCIAANEKGIPAISPATTRFRKQDFNLLIELCLGKKVYVCNDNEINGSGNKAALETLGFLTANGIDAKNVVLPLPSGQKKIDLCLYLKNHTVADFINLL